MDRTNDQDAVVSSFETTQVIAFLYRIEPGLNWELNQLAILNTKPKKHSFPTEDGELPIRYDIQNDLNLEGNLQIIDVDVNILATKFHNNDIYPKRFKAATKEYLQNFLMPLFNQTSIFNNRNLDISKDKPKYRTGQSKFSAALLSRDSHTCRITGARDRTHPNSAAGPVVTLEAAHIIPYQIGWRPTVHAAIESFTEARITPAYLCKENINYTRNGLMLQHDAHKDFDQYRWSFKVHRDTAGKGMTRLEDVDVYGGPISLKHEHFRDIPYTTKNDYPDPSLDLELHYSVAMILDESRVGGVVEERLEMAQKGAPWVAGNLLDDVLSEDSDEMAIEQ